MSQFYTYRTINDSWLPVTKFWCQENYKQLTEIDDYEDDEVLTILYNNNRQAIYDMKRREDISLEEQ